MRATRAQKRAHAPPQRPQAAAALRLGGRTALAARRCPSPRSRQWRARHQRHFEAHFWGRPVASIRWRPTDGQGARRRLARAWTGPVTWLGCRCNRPIPWDGSDAGPVSGVPRDCRGAVAVPKAPRHAPEEGTPRRAPEPRQKEPQRASAPIARPTSTRPLLEALAGAPNDVSAQKVCSDLRAPISTSGTVHCEERCLFAFSA